MAEELKQGSYLGDCELILRIGRGGMATVWVAREHSSKPKEDRLVAVKAMLPDLAEESEFITMFIDEVRLVRAIRHPNIVKIYDVGEHEGIMWMSMEWVEGESLHTVIAEAGKRRAIPPEMAVRIIVDAAAGLHAAHELKDPDGSLRGVVHRDISPHNILIGTSGSVKLVDFGVAKAMGRVSEATRAGQLKGKFGYMSPEQALGKTVDRRSDIFSLGIVLFELTTSRRLFRGDTDVDTLRLIINGQVPRPSSIDPRYPAELERIVMKALERDVERRYQSAEEFGDELRAYLASQQIVVPESGIAGLLKRVVGERIEQRRKAVRAAVKALAAGERTAAELISAENAFTPTGRDKITVTGVSVVTATGLSGISGQGHLASPIPGSGPPSGNGGPSSGSFSGPVSDSAGGPVSGSIRQKSSLGRSHGEAMHRLALIGYIVGAAGLAVAVIVLVFMGHH